MCLIVDANVASRVLSRTLDADFGHVQELLLAPTAPMRLTMVYGGRLRREYLRVGSCLRLLAQLDRSGRARTVADTAVDAKEEVLVAANVCTSDDEHIVALALISGARLLCSHDKALHADFTNPTLVPAPRGKVYQKSRHRALLRKASLACPLCKRDAI